MDAASASFAEILDFAIGREKAAVAFYADLAALAAFAVQKATLAEFRAMEEGHVKLLEGIKTRGAVNLKAAVAVDLGLARRLDAEDVPPASMSYQDILVAAIKKEERSGDLYVSLAAAAVSAEAKGIFERLVAEESRHQRYFEELYETEVARDN